MNRTISQVVFKNKEGRDEAKNLVFRKKVWYTKNIWIPSTTGNAPPVKQGHILLETGWSTCEGGKAGPVYWLREGDAGWLQNVWFVSLKKTTSSHICSALWLVEKPLKSVPWANFIEGFYNLINREFSLGVMCRPLSSWLVTQWDWI